jgi:uncharacterized protein YjiS (DUF1127 family)
MNAIMQIRNAVIGWNDRRAARAAFHRLDDFLLKDIGLSRSDAGFASPGQIRRGRHAGIESGIRLGALHSPSAEMTIYLNNVCNAPVARVPSTC